MRIVRREAERIKGRRLLRSAYGRPPFNLLLGWLALGDRLFYSEEGVCSVEIIRLCSVEWERDGK
jgi:hypothetical protein